MDISVKPTLRGQLVVLRSFTTADADAMYQAANEPVTRRLTGTQATFTREQIETWCAELMTAKDRVDLAIESRQSQEFVGEVVLNEIDPRNLSANFRIALAAPKFFGRGFGGEAAQLMLQYGFRDLGLHRVHLEVYSFNDRALHLYQRLGFIQEGRLREVLYQDGEFHDAIVMGLLRSEYFRDRQVTRER